MPVRSLSSSVFRWPDSRQVNHALRDWIQGVGPRREDLRRLGYFGSYARGDWGVGSDLDVVIVLERSDEPFERRGAAWDLTELPVPVDLLVYTVEEWDRLSREGRFRRMREEMIWVWPQS